MNKIIPGLLCCLIVGENIRPSRPHLVAQNHYLGCHGIDMLVHKVNQYKPSAECWEVCQGKGLRAVSVVGARWCGCGENGEMVPAAADCPVKCYFIPQHKCQCYEGPEENYDEVALSRAFDFMEALPKPNVFRGYNCQKVPLNYYYERLPMTAADRQKECFTLCANVPRRYGSLLIIYKCGCAKSPDAESDALGPVTQACADQMICMELKTSVCLCGDVTVDSNTYAELPNIGPLLNSDKFRCYFTKTTGKAAMALRQPHVESKFRFDIPRRPADCIHTCASVHFQLAAVHAGGICTCHNDMVSGQFDVTDCQDTCVADPLTDGCGGKYTASVYSTAGERNAIVTVEEVELLLHQKMEDNKLSASSNVSISVPIPELEGCYGVDVLIHKVNEYAPSAECWQRCKLLGVKSVAVAGARWCGCTKNGPMGAGDTDCFVYCSFIPQPKCECFQGNEETYDGKVTALVDTFISELPSPHDFKGYNCSATSKEHHNVIFPKIANARALECFTETCKKHNRKLGAYVMGYKCGCKKTDHLYDDSLLPVTQECVSRMICLEAVTSACLCGNQKVDPLSYQPLTRWGPLLASDKFECYRMEQTSEQTRKQRRSQFQDIWHSSSTPTACVRTCAETGYAYAGISRGEICGCQQYPGVRKFAEEDCSIPCLNEDIAHGCGGPYTVSVFPTSNGTGLSVDEMVALLHQDVGATLEIDLNGPLVTEPLQVEPIQPQVTSPPGNRKPARNNTQATGTIEGTTEEELEKDGVENATDDKRFLHLVVFTGVGVFLAVLAIMSICLLVKKRLELGEAGGTPADLDTRGTERSDVERKGATGQGY